MKVKKNYIIFFFIIFLVIGINIHKDYGVYWDEEIQIQIAEDNLNYINNKIKNFNYKNDTKYPEYGIIFEVPVTKLSQLLNISNKSEQIYFRHLCVFLVFFTSCIFFYLIILERFKSSLIGIILTTILITTPRIFADSFYNSKDLVFLSLMIINFYFAINFIKNPTYKSSVLFGLSTAISICSRINGIIIPVLFFFFIFIKYLRNDYNKKLIKFHVIAVFFLIIFTIFFWPFLWEKPLENFTKTFVIFKKYNINIFSLYDGSFINNKTMPWNYSLTWISITTPIAYLAYIILGFSIFFKRILKRLLKINEKNNYQDLWRGNNELFDLMAFSTVFISIFSIIIFNSVVYNGWRHLYYIYPFMLFIAGLSIKYLFIKKKNKNINNFFIFSIILSVFFNINWLIKNHPFQYAFFNNFAGKNVHKNYEIDYWGISNKFALEKILKDSNKNTIKVSNVSDTSLIANINSLPNNKKKIEYEQNFNNTDYIINNNFFLDGNYFRTDKIPKNFIKFFDITVDNNIVLSILKKI
jgi:hypothetical protein